MNQKFRARQYYQEMLEHLKTYFPAPVSDPIMEGYFAHTISIFLARIDRLKSSKPLLGIQQEKFYEANLSQCFPTEMKSVETVIQLLVDYCQGMIVWAHPNAQVNVVSSSTIPSITAFLAAAIYKPNIIEAETSARFAEAEIDAIAMLCDLIGYDSQQSGGVFTFGGTGTLLYGCKLGIEKILGGQTMIEGIREDVKIVASEASHYTRLNVAGWLGLGTKNLVTIPTTRDNEMSLIALEKYLRQAFDTGEKVAVIVATLETTDAFGIDDLAVIVQLRDRLAKEYHLEYLPWVHADSVIGWAWSVFRDYDFDNNPLGFHARTLRSLQDSLQHINSLHLADSLGIDFHKTGYAPYISSVFLVKQRQDLISLGRESEQMPYLYHFGHYHPGNYTLECSRSGASPLAAVANIHLFGKQGYRVLIGHIVEMAEMLRERLEMNSFIRVLNDYNYGPVTLFRVYPQEVNAQQAFQRELSEPSYREQLEQNNQYNRCLFNRIHERAMHGEGVLLSWTDVYQHAHYSEAPAIAAFKSFIMSPWRGLI